MKNIAKKSSGLIISTNKMAYVNFLGKELRGIFRILNKKRNLIRKLNFSQKSRINAKKCGKKMERENGNVSSF